MAIDKFSNTLLVLDDELFNAAWMIDYLYSLDYDLITSSTANEAFDQVHSNIYRMAILDLNVPILPPLDTAALSLGAVYHRYPGLFVAHKARQRGYRGRQVVLYSVHRDSEVDDEARKLGCTYILKGRPREMKREIDAVLAYDPTEKR